MSSLNDLLGAATQSDVGAGVTETGEVVIGSTVAGEPTNIRSSDGSNVVTVTDNKEFTVNESKAISEIVNAIVVGADDNDKKLPTVEAVATFVASAVTATIEFKEFTSKSAFDAFILAGGFIPTIAFVTDTVPFDYTDDTGHSATDLDWMFVVCVEDDGAVTTSMINNSDSSSLTGNEIAAIIAATEDVNFVDDSELSRIGNLPDNTADALGGKVNTESGKGLSQNNFTDTQRNKVDNLPADTNDELSNKLDVQSQGKSVKNTDGSHTFSKSNADPEERDWRLRANTDGSFKIEALDSSGNVKINGTIKIDKTGKVSAPNFSQNNYPVIASNDPMYVLLSALFNVNELTQDMVLKSDSQSAMTLKVTDNADSLGIAWQNTGDSYTLSIERDVVGSNGADMVFRAGRDNDISLMSEAMRIRGTEDGTSSTRGDVIVTNTLHADSVVSTEEATARGQTLVHKKNAGLYREQVTYKSSHPNIGNTTMAAYFAAGARVEFLGTSSGSINMPVISTSPDLDEVQDGTEIDFRNFNSGAAADTTLVAPDSDHVFMVGNVGNIFTGSTVIQSASQVKILARDYRSYGSIGKMCYVIVSA